MAVRAKAPDLKKKWNFYNEPTDSVCLCMDMFILPALNIYISVAHPTALFVCKSHNVYAAIYNARLSVSHWNIHAN